MKVRGFIFDCVDLFYYKCHKINLNHSWSYIDSPNRIYIKKKKPTTNPKTISNSKCALTMSLNHEKIKKDTQNNIKNKAVYK